MAKTKAAGGAKKKSAKKRVARKAASKAAAPKGGGAKGAGGARWRNTPSMYGVHPGVEMVRNWVVTLKDKTGRSLEEWIKAVRKDGPKDEKGRREWFKKQGIGSNTAWWLAERATKPPLAGGWEDEPGVYVKQAALYVDEMYGEGKEALRPIHMRLVEVVEGLGREVKMCPCRTIVPVYRTHVIAQIKPKNKTTIEFGYAPGDMKPSGRLIDTGGFLKKDRITHAIPLTNAGEVDGEVERWLRMAFAMDEGSGRRSKG